MLVCLAMSTTSCTRDSATDAIDSDANGYVCLKCGAKYYTPRKVFLGIKCPACGQEDTLMPAIGYYCSKDKHLTIRAVRGDDRPIVCEVCQTPLANAMKQPQEKELKAWGAVKAP